MTPTNPRGGRITARWRSVLVSRQVVEPDGMPDHIADPGASPSMTTLTVDTVSVYQMVSGAGSSARQRRVASTINRGAGVGTRAVSRDATAPVFGTAR